MLILRLTIYWHFLVCSKAKMLININHLKKHFIAGGQTNQSINMNYVTEICDFVSTQKSQSKWNLCPLLIPLSRSSVVCEFEKWSSIWPKPKMQTLEAHWAMNATECWNKNEMTEKKVEWKNKLKRLNRSNGFHYFMSVDCELFSPHWISCIPNDLWLVLNDDGGCVGNGKIISSIVRMTSSIGNLKLMSFPVIDSESELFSYIPSIWFGRIRKIPKKKKNRKKSTETQNKWNPNFVINFN